MPSERSAPTRFRRNHNIYCFKAMRCKSEVLPQAHHQHAFCISHDTRTLRAPFHRMEQIRTMTSLKELSTDSATAHATDHKYRPDIDGLRAIAVLAVVAFHAFPSKIKGGFVGVDVFFVISGFLITGIILGHLKQNSFSLVDFYSRRVNRIFPALLLVIGSTWAFSMVALFPLELEQLGKHMLGGATFISNFMLLDEVGYFDSSNDTKLMLHLWSLGVEEQFYLIWPLILFVCWRLRANILLSITIIGLISFCLNAYYATANPSLDFYAPHTRFWELLIGAALACVMNSPKYTLQTNKVSSRKLNNIVAGTGLFLILLAVKFISKRYLFPGWWALFPVLGAAMIIYAGPNSWVNEKLLSSRLMVAIGLISFPLYLWHWPLLALAREMTGDEPSVAIRLVIVTLSFVLAWLTYKLVEIPLRRTKRKGVQSGVLVILMIAMGLAGAATWLTGGFPNRSNILWSGPVFSQFVGANWSYTKNDYCLNTYAKPDNVKSYQWYFCYSSKPKTPDIILIGNSYANHILPGLVHNEHTSGNSILSIGTCSPDLASENTPPSGRLPCTGTRIGDQEAIINRIVKTTKGLKLVILSGFENKTSTSLIETTRERINLLESTGASVLVLTPHTKITHDIKSCYGRPFVSAMNSCDISKDVIEENKENFRPLIEQIAKTNPQVKFFDTDQVFCTTGTCSFIKDGIPLLRDGASHLSEYGSDELAKLLVAWAKFNEPKLLAE